MAYRNFYDEVVDSPDEGRTMPYRFEKYDDNLALITALSIMVIVASALVILLFVVYPELLVKIFGLT